ncbi:hypothetical protein PALS1_099 [Staphylococcus phage PALS_1]|nr:hypothetical protein PALS1_099 [Staphylococcus phage PALS_1]
MTVVIYYDKLYKKSKNIKNEIVNIKNEIVNIKNEIVNKKNEYERRIIHVLK